MPFRTPDRARERALAQRYGLIAGVDEVGRGSFAGPLCVGLVVVAADMADPPTGLADSKLLSPARRESLAPQVARWALASSVGWASPADIDRAGLRGALAQAGQQALKESSQQLARAGHDPIGAVLLDGPHDWLSTPAPDLFTQRLPDSLPRVYPEVKADLTSVVVAAASIIAKVARDRYMEALTDPGYDWKNNKGYGSARHRDALLRLGPSSEHRRSWNLPGTTKTEPK